ncbi:MAG: TIGR03936 family radical SAM-associated protein [Acidimicrobiales bacterium]
MTTFAVEGRLRLRYSKLGKIRFTSQRDVARIWERALRRSRLPVAWSGGFSPRPLLSFGPALPTCAESMGEYLDIQLGPGEVPGRGATAEQTPMPGAEWESRLRVLLTSLLPSGLTVQAVAALPPGSPSLQHEISSCTWDLEVAGVSEGRMESRIDAFLRASGGVVVRRMRKGRTVEDDIRPAIRSLMLVAGDGARGGDEPIRLSATVATRPRGVRPGELLEGLGTDLALVRARRTHHWIEHGAARWEPLTEAGDLPGYAEQHAQERAS